MFSFGAFHRQKPVGLCLVAVVNVTRAHLTIAVPAVCHILKPLQWPLVRFAARKMTTSLHNGFVCVGLEMRS